MTYPPDETHGDHAPPAPLEQTVLRRKVGCLLEILETLVLTLAIYLLIHNFVAQPFEVEMTSMVPTIVSGEYVLIDKITPRFGGYDRGDIIVFRPPPGFEQRGGVPFIKRVIGLPGDRVRLEDGHVYVTPLGGVQTELSEPYLREKEDGGVADTLPRGGGQTEWVVPEGEYFVMGDNRPDSQDSRSFGPIERDLIIGRAWLRYLPLDRIGLIKRPQYPGKKSGRDKVIERLLASRVSVDFDDSVVIGYYGTCSGEGGDGVLAGEMGPSSLCGSQFVRDYAAEAST